MTAYAQSGVDIAAGTAATKLMAEALRSTHGPAVLAGIGAFGGCFDLSATGETGSVLVASTDGVGTKTVVASALGRYDTVGQDLVNHCVNDILVQGARPLFFMDYIAVAQLDPQQVAALVGGVAAACRIHRCALLGGETAEMPDVYQPGAFDLAGTIVGIAEREKLLPRAVAAGNVVLALPSSGLHTNGYSLARRVLAPLGYESRPALLGGTTIGEALLAIHRPYLHEIEALWAAEIDIHALAHITGGGLWDNLPRVLPPSLGAAIKRDSWPIPPICELLVGEGKLAEREAYHTLNMGLGMLIIVPQTQADTALRNLPEAQAIGEITAEAGVLLH